MLVVDHRKLTNPSILHLGRQLTDALEDLPAHSQSSWRWFRDVLREVDG